MIRGPRSVAIPLIVTVLVLVGLTFCVARFGERITIRILNPVATLPPQVVHPGETLHIGAIVDAGDAIYKVVDQIGLGINYYPPNSPSWSAPDRNRSLVTNYDRVSKRFTREFSVSRFPVERLLSIDVAVIDRAGRVYGSAREPAPPGSSVLLRVAPY
jgi:hypothetical protein